MNPVAKTLCIYFNPYSPNVLYEGQMSCVKNNYK